MVCTCLWWLLMASDQGSYKQWHGNMARARVPLYVIHKGKSCWLALINTNYPTDVWLAPALLDLNEWLWVYYSLQYLSTIFRKAVFIWIHFLSVENYQLFCVTGHAARSVINPSTSPFFCHFQSEIETPGPLGHWAGSLSAHPGAALGGGGKFSGPWEK